MKQIITMVMLAVSLIACTSKLPTKEKAPIMVELSLKVDGMTCDHCEESISKGVSELAGIDSISANHEDSTTFVRFDTVQVKLAQITAAIEKRGYHVKK